MNCTKENTTETSTTQCVSAERSREVLIFTQDPELRSFVRKAIYAGSASSVFVSNDSDVTPCLRRDRHDLLVIGIDSPESLDILAAVHGEFPKLPIVAVARMAGPELVRDTLCAGATDFLFGSFSSKKFNARITSILDTRPGSSDEVPAGRIAREKPAAPIRAEASSVEIVSSNPKMQRVLEIANTVAPTESTVLIQGESGTGKELIATQIHQLSKRREAPFVQVNCGALPENLLESQLFGHEKGSFTGAVHRQVGLFEVADQGTMFLDEVGETSLDMQVKLLRVLQFQQFRRVGGSEEIQVDVRVIAATNRDIAVDAENNDFRSDLYYRLNVISLEVPPLRERLEEIPHLVALFSERFAREKGLPAKTFTTETVERLQKYRWAGNVRELENAIERLMLLSKGDVVSAVDLDEHLGETTEMSFPSVFAPTLTMDEVKRIHVANVLRENDGNKMKTARILKINVKTLYNLIKSLDINV